jgi:hypothetical protein
MEDASRFCAGVLPFIEYDHAIDHDVFNPDGILEWILEGGLVGDPLCVEDSDVGGHAGAEEAAVSEAVDLGGK